MKRDAGHQIVRVLRANVEETKCCGRVCVPGTITRLYLRRKVNEEVRRAYKDALLDAARRFEDEGGDWLLSHPKHVASRLRGMAREVRIREVQA